MSKLVSDIGSKFLLSPSLPPSRISGNDIPPSLPPPLHPYLEDLGELVVVGGHEAGLGQLASQGAIGLLEGDLREGGREGGWVSLS